MTDLFRSFLFTEEGGGEPDPGGGGGLLGGGGPPAGGDPVPSKAGGGDPAPFSFTGLLGDDGAFREGWQNDLAAAHPELEPFRETFALYKSPFEAMKALGHSKRLVGRNLSNVETVLNPNPNDPTAMGLYRQALGIPDEASVEAYEFRPGDDLKGVLDDEQLGAFAKKAHELGLNKKQFGELVNYQAGIMQATGVSLEEGIQAADQSRKAEFWEEANKALGGKEATDKALDLTVRMLRAGGLDDETIAGQIAPGLHHMGPAFLKAMTALAANTAEDRIPAGGSSASQAMSAKDSYRSIMHDPANPKHAIYHNEMHPEHSSVRAEVMSLIKRAARTGG